MRRFDISPHQARTAGTCGGYRHRDFIHRAVCADIRHNEVHSFIRHHSALALRDNNRLLCRGFRMRVHLTRTRLYLRTADRLHPVCRGVCTGLGSRLGILRHTGGHQAHMSARCRRIRRLVRLQPRSHQTQESVK